MTLTGERGYSLIEVLIVIAIIFVLVLMSAATFSAFNRASAVNASAEIILAVLAEARTKTLASQDESVYGVHFDTTSVTLFKGDTYMAEDPDNELRVLASSASITNVALSDGGNEIVFKRLSGETDESGTIEIASQTGNESTVITIEVTGIAH
jgi:prepilin-type N-terminal cleavage/methylation domain-containing protein